MTGQSFNFRLYFEKFISIAISFIIFLILIQYIHESIHYLAGVAVGDNGRMVVSWGGVGYYFIGDVPLSPIKLFIIKAAGGLGTALIYGLLWWESEIGLKHTKWELDDCMAVGWLTIQQILYIPLDISGFWNNPWLNGLTYILSFLIIFLIYKTKLINWFLEKK